MKIEKPGTYRLDNGLKAIVIAIVDIYAIGYISAVRDTPGSWLCIDGRFWTTDYGIEHSAPDFRVVSEWKEPRTVTVELTMTSNGHVWFGNVWNDEGIVARKTIAITEGEGM